MNVKYSLLVYDTDGELVADLTGRALSREVKLLRNRAEVITAVFDADNIRDLAISIGMQVEDIFAVNRNEMRLKRGDRVIMAGEIQAVIPSIDGDRRTITVRAHGWLDLLASRYTDESEIYSAVDAGAIAWDLINDSQNLTNGDFGITEGEIQTSVNRDRTYSYKNIKDAIIQLSEVINGFDFEFTWDKQFNVYYPGIGSDRPDVVFTYPGNIKRLSFVRDGTDIANKIIARGAGFGVDVFKAEAADTISQSIYGLREKFLQFNDITNTTTLQQHADGELANYAKFYDMPDLVVDGSIDPQFGSYGIGDTVRIFVSEELNIFQTINGSYRIEAIDLSIDDQDQETVRLRLMRA